MEFSVPTSNINEKNFGIDQLQRNFMEGKNNHIKSLSSHPLVLANDRHLEKKEIKSLKEISMLYGTALSSQRHIERSIAASMNRGSTFGVSNHALKLTLGLYDRIEVSDYLGKNKGFDVDESLFYKAYTKA